MKAAGDGVYSPLVRAAHVRVAGASIEAVTVKKMLTYLKGGRGWEDAVHGFESALQTLAHSLRSFSLRTSSTPLGASGEMADGKETTCVRMFSAVP